MIGKMCGVSFVFALSWLMAAPPAWSQETTQSEVAFLVEALDHPDARIRQNAVTKLGELPDKPFEALVAVLEQGTEFQAACAAVVLKNFKIGLARQPIPTATQTALYGILANPQTEAWRWNITAVLLAGRPYRSENAEDTRITSNSGIAEESLEDHVDQWIWGVNHPNPRIQLPSLWALQKTKQKGKSAEKAVAGLLHRPRKPLTSVVLQRQIVTDGSLGIQTPIPQYDPLTILETLAAIGADPALMAEPLIALTKSDCEYVRVDAAAMLGKLDAAKLQNDPRPFAAQVLAKLAAEPWGKVREAAVRELGNIGEPAAGQLPVLIALLREGDDALRLQAAISLGKFGAAAKPALPALNTARRYAELDTQPVAAALKTAIETIEKASGNKSKML